MSDADGVEKLNKALKMADDLLKEISEQPSRGYIAFKKLTSSDGGTSEIYEVINVKLS